MQGINLGKCEGKLENYFGKLDEGELHVRFDVVGESLGSALWFI